MCTERTKIALLINVSIVLILLAISCGGNDWIHNGKRTAGLWKLCTLYDGYCKSHDIDNMSVSQKVIQAFTILSCISAIICVFASVFIQCVGHLDARYISIGLFLTAFSIIIALCLFITYAYLFNVPKHRYGWCFAVGWTGAIWAKFAAINALCVSAQTPQPVPTIV